MRSPFDDRVSNFEAPPNTGFFVDAQGAPWASRPDNVVDKYMSKVSLKQDDYWQYKKYLNNRQWFELDMFLERLENKSEGDDLIRIQNSRNVISKLQKEGNN